MQPIHVNRFLSIRWSLLLAGLFMSGTVGAQLPYTVQYRLQDTAHSTEWSSRILQTQFPDSIAVVRYLQTIPDILAQQGYPSASVDSVNWSASGVSVLLYRGHRYTWASIRIHDEWHSWFREQQGSLTNGNLLAVPFAEWDRWSRRLLSFCANTGYPFAAIRLDSIVGDAAAMRASLVVDKGRFYTLDSIRLIGGARLSARFLNRYLAMNDGSAYSQHKIDQVNQKIKALSFVTPIQPADLTMLGTGAILNVYAKPRRNSRFQALVGLQPSPVSNKLILTGDINLQLQNLFAGGEDIRFLWQQLQYQSPRLQIGYAQPYLGGSAFGVDVHFDLFKKDSSFLQMQGRLGTRYQWSATQSIRAYLLWQRHRLLEGGIDTARIKTTLTLPDIIDVGSSGLGIEYRLQQTDFPLNPRRGIEITTTASMSNRSVYKNETILALNDAGGNSLARLYDTVTPKTAQLRIETVVNKFWPVGRYATFKTGVQGGLLEGTRLYRNELFQIGGYKRLRGFDEESIYASGFLVATMEYRLLFSARSYLGFFVDAGWVRNRYVAARLDTRYQSAGVSLLVETAAGLFNASFALGKRSDLSFNWREASRLHFGYISYF
jgi:outer membrane protein assembly factor BamA